MADNRCIRIYDLKQKIRYHPEVGTYVSEEDIDLAERVFCNGGVIGKWEGTPIGNCFNCLHAEDGSKIGKDGWLNCLKWGAARIDPFGFCHMWKQKN